MGHIRLALASLAIPVALSCSLAPSQQPLRNPSEAPPEAATGSPNDPFRWLEATESPQTQAWLAGRQSEARAYFASFDREVARWNERIRRAGAIELRGVQRARGSRSFYSAHGSGGDAVRLRDNGAERELLRSDRGFLFWEPSHDGSRVAYAAAGGQPAEIRIRGIEDAIEVVVTSSASPYSRALWDAADRGLFLVTAKPEGQFLLYQPLAGGNSLTLLGPAAYVTLGREGAGRIVASTWDAQSAQAVFALDSSAPEKAPEEVVPSSSTHYTFIGSAGENLYFQTDEPPGGAVVEFRSRERRTVFAAPTGQALDDAALGDGVLAVVTLTDGLSRLRLMATDGRTIEEVSLDPGQVSEMIFAADGLHFAFESFTQPPSIRLHDAHGTRTVYASASAATDLVTDFVEYASLDGTRIPMLLVHRKDLAYDGSNPTVLYVYGAFGIAMMKADFDPALLPWLEDGGVFALAGIRGGGERGPAWHEAGRGANKMRAIEDVSAAAEFLVARGVTTPERLGLTGTSAGGLNAAAAVMLRPERFGAAVISAALLDMLRYHLAPTGETLIPEYGHPDQARDQLLRYSPLHNVRPRCYPPLLVVTGADDATVPPWHSYKFAAAVQGAKTCPNPALLWIIPGEDHTGLARDAARDAEARAYAFFARELK